MDTCYNFHFFLKIAFVLAKSADPDEIPHYGSFHMVLLSLSKLSSCLGGSGHQRVKIEVVYGKCFIILKMCFQWFLSHLKVCFTKTIYRP